MVTTGRSAKAGTRGGGVDVGWWWVEVKTSTWAAVAAADGEGGSSSGEMADSSRRVRVFWREGERERKERPGGGDKWLSVGGGYRLTTWAFNLAFFSSLSNIDHLSPFFFLLSIYACISHRLGNA